MINSVVGRKWERNKGKCNLIKTAKSYNIVTGYGDRIWTSLGQLLFNLPRNIKAKTLR